MFKVGDKVRVVRNSSAGHSVGTTGRIDNIDTGEFPCLVRSDNSFTNMWHPESDLVLISDDAKKTTQVNYLLKYDLDVDPVEEFETLEEVRARIAELAEKERSLKRESIKVYRIAEVMTVSLSTAVEFNVKPTRLRKDGKPWGKRGPKKRRKQIPYAQRNY